MDFSELERLLEGNKLENLLVDKKWVIEDEDFKPIVRKTVSYVAAAVVFNEKGELLMTQEGFHPHKGHWYLPAGRVDPNETLSEAVKREVREETGIEFEPTTLIAVEAPSGNWLRFTFTGNVTGGKLRTLAEKCDETLRGAYWPVDLVLKASKNKGDPKTNFVLRGSDILKLVECGVNYHKTVTRPHSTILPCDIPHNSLMMRLVFLHKSQKENESDPDIHVLSMKNDAASTSLKLPLLKFDPNITSGPAVVSLFCQDMIKVLYTSIYISGLLGVEHNGTLSNVKKGNYLDGFLLTVLVKMKDESEAIPGLADSCTWCPITDVEFKKKLLDTFNGTNGCGALPFYC